MGKLFINASVENETREFIFDTGSPTILTTDLANALKVEVIGQNTGTDANGREVTMDIAIVETLRLGDLTFRDVPVLIFYPHQLELGPCIFDGGVIGSEILPGSIWNIDTKQRRLTVSAPGSATPLDEPALTAKMYRFGYPHTMHADFCVDALNEAIGKYGPPEIMNTAQGSQFTGSDWITALTDARVRISMDGRGRYLDNIFIERLWRSLKYEAIYLQDIADGFAAQHVIDEWMYFYNRERPHSALGKATPDEAYGQTNELKKAA